MFLSARSDLHDKYSALLIQQGLTSAPLQPRSAVLKSQDEILFDFLESAAQGLSVLEQLCASDFPFLNLDGSNAEIQRQDIEFVQNRIAWIRECPVLFSLDENLLHPKTGYPRLLDGFANGRIVLNSQEWQHLGRRLKKALALHAFLSQCPLEAGDVFTFSGPVFLTSVIY